MNAGPLSVFVPGQPAPQGSKRYLGQRGGRGITVESSKALGPWRADIREHVLARRGDAPPVDGPLQVDLVFVMPRPKSLAKSRPTPAAVKKSDVDKLARAVLDALTSAGAWLDDKQVCDLRARKRLAELGERTGCWIEVSDLADQRWVAEDSRAERLADTADGTLA